jgi:hypothetical protein
LFKEFEGGKPLKLELTTLTTAAPGATGDQESQNLANTMKAIPNFPGHPSLMSFSMFCDESGLLSQELGAALQAQRIFAVEMDGQLFVPDFFLDNRNDPRQLESICRVLGGLPGGSKLQFFTTPKGSLGGRTPLDALRNGELALVHCAAEGFVER